MIPWKLIAFIALVVLLVTFIGFNLEYKATLSLIVTTIEEVPVFLLVLVSFFGGMLFSIPFSVRNNRKKNPEQ